MVWWMVFGCCCYCLHVWCWWMSTWMAKCGFEWLHIYGVPDSQKRIWKLEKKKASRRMYVTDEINEMNGVSNKNERIKPKLNFYSSSSSSSGEKHFIAMHCISYLLSTISPFLQILEDLSCSFARAFVSLFDSSSSLVSLLKIVILSICRSKLILLLILSLSFVFFLVYLSLFPSQFLSFSSAAVYKSFVSISLLDLWPQSSLQSWTFHFHCTIIRNSFRVFEFHGEQKRI